MPKASKIQTNFTAGEVSPKIFGRVDVSKYDNGAEEISNFVPTPHGGAQRTPGTTFVGEVRNSTEKARLIPFQFSTTQAYMLEFNDSKIRFYRNKARIVESSVTIVSHTNPDGAPKVVTATGHGYSDGEFVIISGVTGDTSLNGKEFRVVNKTANTFELENRNTPFAIVNGNGGTAGTDGAVVRIYEIAQPYAEDDLATLQFAQTADIMYIFHKDYFVRKLSRTGHTAWTLSQPQMVGGPYLPENTTATTINPSGTTGSVTLVASTAIFASTDVGRLVRFQNGVNARDMIITAFTNSTTVTATVVGTLTGATAIVEWSLGIWSDTTGHPATGTFYEQRLAFAATIDNPQTIWLTQPENFETFTIDGGTDSDDSIQYTIATEQVNAIKWLSAKTVLFLGTQGGVFSLSSGVANEALTPTNVAVKRETTYGAAALLPSQIGNFTYYVQRDTLKFREISFDFNIDQFKASDITILSEHITAGGIVETGYQQSPYNLLWAIRGDGKIAVLTREIDQEVAAWSEQATSGSYENIGVIPATTVTEGDEVWFVVNRTINGTTVRYVEYLMPFDHGTTVQNAFFVHSGLKYSGASTATLTGLDHLEGEEVQVLANGTIQTVTVSSGSITLAAAVTAATVGLGYTSTIKTLRLDVGSAIGTSQGMLKRINNVIVRLIGTSGTLEVGDTNLQQQLVDGTWDGTFTDGDLVSHHDGGWDTEAQVIITISDPLPAHITAVIVQEITEDK